MSRKRLEDAKIGADSLDPETQDRRFEQRLPYSEVLMIRMLMPDRGDLTSSEGAREQADEECAGVIGGRSCR